MNNQITQISQLAEQIQNQLNIYNNLLQNTAQLPNHVWGQVESDLKSLQNVVAQGRWAMSMMCSSSVSRALPS